MEIMISVLGAVTAIAVSIISSFLTHRNHNILEIKKLKQEHYVSYIASLHNLAADNNCKDKKSEYTYCRDKLLIVGDEDVIRAIMHYEEKAFGRACKLHDIYLTEILKEIRKDLKIKDKNYPLVQFKK